MSLLFTHHNQFDDHTTLHFPKSDQVAHHERLPQSHDYPVVLIEVTKKAKFIKFSVLIINILLTSQDSIRKYGSMEPNLERYVATNLQIYNTSIYCGVVLGFLLIGLGFFGTCSSFIESQFLIFAYSLLLVLIFIVLSTMGSVLHWFRTGSRSLETCTLLLRGAVEHSSCGFWKELQEDLMCCGMDGSATERCAGVAPCIGSNSAWNCTDLMFKASAAMARSTTCAILPILVVELVAILFAIHLWNLIHSGIRFFNGDMSKKVMVSNRLAT